MNSGDEQYLITSRTSKMHQAFSDSKGNDIDIIQSKYTIVYLTGHGVQNKGHGWDE